MSTARKEFTSDQRVRQNVWLVAAWKWRILLLSKTLKRFAWWDETTLLEFCTIFRFLLLLSRAGLGLKIKLEILEFFGVAEKLISFFENNYRPRSSLHITHPNVEGFVSGESPRCVYQQHVFSDSTLNNLIVCFQTLSWINKRFCFFVKMSKLRDCPRFVPGGHLLELQLKKW